MGMVILPPPIWWRKLNWKSFGSKHLQSSLMPERVTYLEHLKQWHFILKLSHWSCAQGPVDLMLDIELCISQVKAIWILPFTFASAKVKSIDIWCWFDDDPYAGLPFLRQSDLIHAGHL
jgi:hypothetical protein